MKIFYILFSLLLLTTVGAKAQDEAIFSHYLFNPTIINPGATGFSETHQIWGHYRNAWTGFTDQPRTFIVSYNGALSNNLGLGAMVFSENIAQLNRLRGQLSYAFRYKLGDNFKLGIGLSTQIQQLRLVTQADNTLVNFNDNVLARAMDGRRTFDASLGFFGSYKEKLYFGVSLPGLISARLDKVTGTSSQSFFATFQALAGYKIKAGDIMVEPTLMVGQIQNAPFQADISLRASFLEEIFMAGVIYKAYDKGTFGLLLGTKFNGIRINYSYDYSFQRFQNFNSGGHEITLGYEFQRTERKIDREKKYRN